MKYIEMNSGWINEMNKFKKEQLIELLRESYNQKTLLLQSIPKYSDIDKAELTQRDLKSIENAILTTGYRFGIKVVVDLILKTLNT